MAGALPTYFGTRDALVRIFQDEGWRALYAGIAPALLGAGVLHAHMLVIKSTNMHSLSISGRIGMSSSGDELSLSHELQTKGNLSVPMQGKHCKQGVLEVFIRSCQTVSAACAGLSWGIYFTAYNNAKVRWQGLRNQATLPAQLHLLSAAEAGCIVRLHHPDFPDAKMCSLLAYRAHANIPNG